MATPLFDMVRHTLATAPGTGALQLGPAVPGFQTFAQAGALDGDRVSYSIAGPNNTWEVGHGVYSVAGPSIRRTNPLYSSSNNQLVWFDTTAVIWGTFLSEDLTVTAGSLLGNSGTVTATPTSIALGSGLSLSASGTLSASGSGGTVTQIVAGANLTGGTITTSGTIAIQSSPTFIAVSTQPLIINGNTFIPSSIVGTMLQIVGDDATPVGFQLDGFGNAASLANPAFVGRRSQGTAGTPLAVAADMPLLNVAGRGYDGSAYSITQIVLSFRAAAAWTTTDHSTYAALTVTPAGSTATAEVLRVTSAGILLVGTTAAVGTEKIQTNDGIRAAILNITGTLTAFPLGAGLSLNGGSISAQQQITVNATAAGTFAITPSLSATSVLVNGPAAGGAVVLTMGAMQVDQRLNLIIKQGATAATWTLGTGFAFGTTVPSYIATAVANKFDVINVISNLGTIGDVMQIAQGFSV